MALQEIGDAARRIADEVGPSVVGVGRAGPRGSGVVIAEGKVLTNAHNVRSDSPTVTFSDGRSVEGSVRSADRSGDLALIEVDTGGVRPIEWADELPRNGTPVFGLANPGGRGLRVTFGLISATDRSFRGPRGRRIRGGLEHSAPLPRGSSGGPVVDAEGRLLGLNTSRRGEGFYVAIPADGELRDRIAALERGETREGPRLGIGIAPPFVARRLRRAVGLPERDGLLVRMVEDGSPAAAAGIASGDLIVGVGGRPVESVSDLEDALEGSAGRLELKVLRGVEERTVSVDLARGGPAPDAA